MKTMTSAARAITAALLATACFAGAAWAGAKGVGTNPGAWLPAAVNNLNVSWWYNWASSKEGASGNGEYIPQIWGSADVNSTELAAAGSSGASAILTFNEPDNSSQANMTVAQALSLWPQIEAVAKANHMLIGSPAAVDWQPGGWLDQFMQGARADGYEVDFICMHPYPGDSTVAAATSDLENMLSSAHSYYGLPIWVTEFALANFGKSGDPYFGQATEASFATSSVQMMNSLSYVQRYAWLAAIPSIGGYTDTATCTSTGANTQVGVAYAAAGGGTTTISGEHALAPETATGSRLDDFNSSTTNNSKVALYQADGGSNQEWNFALVSGSNGYNAATEGPYCLDDCANPDGAVCLWGCNGGPNQQWNATENSDGSYTFVNSGDNDCLDDFGGGTSNGNTIGTWTCNSQSNQKWWLD